MSLAHLAAWWGGGKPGASQVEPSDMMAGQPSEPCPLGHKLRGGRVCMREREGEREG